MGAKVHGTWAQFYEDVHDHPKTMRLAIGIAKAIPLSVLGPSRDSHATVLVASMCKDVAASQLHRLACWCFRSGNDGKIGHLDAGSLCDVVRWRDLATAQAVFDAWMGSGFIDNPNTQDACLHDFTEYFALALRGRERKRLERERKATTVTGQSQDSPATVTRLSGRSRKPKAVSVSSVADAPAVVPKLSSNPSVAAFQAAYRDRYGSLPAISSFEAFGTGLARAAAAKGDDPEAVGRAAAAFVTCGEEFVAGKAHPWSEFVRQYDRWHQAAKKEQAKEQRRREIAEAAAAEQQTLQGVEFDPDRVKKMRQLVLAQSREVAT
jgi:hypothetical protein